MTDRTCGTCSVVDCCDFVMAQNCGETFSLWRERRASMPRYEILVTRTTSETATVVLEAENEEEAQDIVVSSLEKLHETDSGIDTTLKEQLEKLSWELEDENFYTTIASQVDA